MPTAARTPFPPAASRRSLQNPWTPTTRSSSIPIRKSPRPGSSAPAIDELADVFAKDVRLQIHGIANLSFAQRRHFVRVRNEPNAKTPFFYRCIFEADAVHRDRAFENQ